MLRWWLGLVGCCCAWGWSANAGAQTKLLRFPDIHERNVVFCHGGDIWRVAVTGGLASRVTAHPGLELFPKISPDGEWLAFTGQYDGDEQVYVVPVAGGEPRQLTHYPARGPLTPRGGYDNQVYGWTPDGSAILFRSLRDADGGEVETALYTVPVRGGLPQKLPMPTAGAGDFSADGKKVVYSPLFRDFRTWKRYEGGWAQDLYVFDVAAGTDRVIAPSVRTERDPMWIGDRIYFVSDRDGTLNLFAADLALDKVTQLTQSRVGDVRWASSDNRRWIVYEMLGELVVFDTQTETPTPIAIQVPSDSLARRPARLPVDKFIEEFDLSPQGERALFVARGDIFTAPIEKGLTRNLTRSSNSHDRSAAWLPDGSQIAFISDRTGEDQVYLVPQDGSAPPQAFTDKLESMLFNLRPSPDSKRLAFSDKYGKLHVLTIATREVLEIADEQGGLLRDFSWSPCGGYLAVVLSDENDFGSLHLWSAAENRLQRITDESFDESNPTWDPEGKFLYFLARHEFAPQFSSVEWNFAGNRDIGVFALALRSDVAHPFPVESDEVRAPHPQANSTATPPAAKSDGRALTKIDFNGLAERVTRVPLEADNLSGLTAIPGHLLYVVRGAGYYGRDSGTKSQLKIFDLGKREASTLVDDVSGFAVSHQGGKVLVRAGNAYQLLDAKPKASERKTVSTKDLAVDRVPAEEWQTIFQEVWRRYRDFFYVRNMHGYDWKAIGDRYRALLPHVAHRADLNYLLGEMVAELNAGHCYIEGGDLELPGRAPVGLPGARLRLDPATGKYRIASILRGDNTEERYRSPLTEVGVQVNVGDYVLAIEGEELRGDDDPYRLLRHKSQLVTWTVNSRPTLEGSRKISYRPIATEEPLLYYNWVRRNRERVAAATGGKVGYLHIPDMGAGGIYEFIKWYYPQVRKEGLVIDVRSNGGGNVSAWIIERLDSKLLGTRFGSLGDRPGTYPSTVFHGHLVCLINETSASDGDIFPHRFRQAGLGPLIGKRTWGGTVGITNLGPLLDGGTVFVPLQATNSPSGEYIIEGRGVEPDIEVENRPRQVLDGQDPQLERGIAEVFKRIQAEPKRLPARPADPIKTPDRR